MRAPKPAVIGLAAILVSGNPASAAILKGKVSNQAGSPIPNAIVTHIPQGIMDTTGADGSYSLATSGLAPGLPEYFHGLRLRRSVLEFALERAAPVQVGVYDSRGERSASDAKPFPAGSHRWDIGKLCRGKKVLFIQVSIGRGREIFLRGPERGAALPSEIPVRARASQAKTSAGGDSLRVSAVGYLARTVPVAAGDTAVDITLEAATPGIFNVFAQIPQFGIYSEKEPRYAPPAGVLMWNFGTVFLVKLSPAQKAKIGADLKARITYHAQCDNYDRLGGLFYVLTAPGTAPAKTDARIEIGRFITPFSDYRLGSLATYVFPALDLAAHARALSDPGRDVWVGITGGSNPYDGDPCTGAAVTADFRAIGFKYSVDFYSNQPIPPGPAAMAEKLFHDMAAAKLPITATFANNTGSPIAGRITVIVSGHGANAGGAEYRYTRDTVSVNGTRIGAFSTQIDCASYEKYSPDGNPGIFRDNLGGNPRNWCPGALVPLHTYPATLMPGSNGIRLGISPSDLPSGSSYATSIVFTSP